MKTNIFKSSIMALAMVASFSACTQDELGTEATTGEDALNVIAYSNDFVSSDAESRVTNTEYTTSFDEGDAIGIFVVRDGQALVSNMKMTLGSDGAWKGENNSPLYYYKDADYIAYYPYTEGLTATSESDIVKTFTEKLTADQGTAEAYRNADLMSVTVPAESVERGGNISFNMAHKMSMIELKIPVRRYTTEEGENGYNYSVPTKIDLEINDTKFTPYTFADGVYRCIVAASATEDVTVNGCFYDGDTPVYFPKATAENADPSESVTPNDGTYKCLNITYTGIPTTVIVRPIEVGDYFYEDGNIYPYGDQSDNDLSTPPSAGCVGVVFSTTTSVNDQNAGWKLGYVMALNNTGTSIVTWKNANTEDEGYDSFDIDVESKDDSFQAMIDYLDGYTSSKKITDSSNEATHPAVFAAKNYNVTIPETTSGWYLPSMGQFAAFVNNIGVTDPTKKFTAQNCSEKASSPKFDESGEDAPAVIERINATFVRVGGSLRSDMAITEKDWNLRWWGCEQTSFDTQTTNGKAWCIDMNYGTNTSNKQYAKFLFLSRDKTDNTKYNRVRPVFAF